GRAGAGVAGRLVAVGTPLGADDGRQVAGVEAPPGGGEVVGVGEAFREEVLVGPERGGEAVGPRTVLVGVVGLGAAPPGVVGEVVVVPDRHHRVGGVQRLQVGVA